MDGTDCAIQGPIPFHKSWFSHKLNKAGLRYEVGISINNGFISWVHGPFKCGSFPDINIFKTSLRKKLFKNEFVIADRGYKDWKCISSPIGSKNRNIHKRIRSRHEVVNCVLKNFGILNQKYRGSRKEHGIYFTVIANITQVKMGLEPKHLTNEFIIFFLFRNT